jgi:hypothetical protein
MHRRIRDQFDCCPICGKKDATATHRCKPSTYSAIDAANTRAANNDDRRSDQTWYPPSRDYTLRLKEGFRLLADDEPERRGR